MIKILTVVGARPQFIKAAVVSRALKQFPEVDEFMVHTGQHYDDNMSEVFFREMEIPKPRYNLAVRESTHGAMTGAMLGGIEEILLKEKPEVVIVFGDTNSTLAGALAARKLQIKLVHVEAGLRSFNMKMPEEINRIVADRISDLLCCPTENAMKNLVREGFDNFPCTYFHSGDVMLDALQYYASKSAARSSVISKLKPDRFFLCTIHRAENTDDDHALEQIISALNSINEVTPVVMPMHPRTKKRVDSLGIKTTFKVLEPQGYFDMIELLKHCSLVITDSGGLQKEAYFFKKNCLCIRNETEWTELQRDGYVLLAGNEKKKILDTFHQQKTLSGGFNENYYGEGNASLKIAEQILKM